MPCVGSTTYDADPENSPAHVMAAFQPSSAAAVVAVVTGVTASGTFVV
jgi:hypothetical protein